MLLAKKKDKSMCEGIERYTFRGQEVVCVREKERERQRGRDRESEKEKERKRENKNNSKIIMIDWTDFVIIFFREFSLR